MAAAQYQPGHFVTEERGMDPLATKLLVVVVTGAVYVAGHWAVWRMTRDPDKGAP